MASQTAAQKLLSDMIHKRLQVVAIEEELISEIRAIEEQNTQLKEFNAKQNEITNTLAQTLAESAKAAMDKLQTELETVKSESAELAAANAALRAELAEANTALAETRGTLAEANTELAAATAASAEHCYRA